MPLILMGILLYLAGPASAILDQYHDPWHEKYRIEGSWDQLEVDQPIGPCESCQYLIQMYSNQLPIFNSFSSSKNPTNLYGFLNKYPQLQKQTSLKHSSSYQLIIETIKPQGLYIKAEQTSNKTAIVLITVLFIILNLLLNTKNTKQSLQQYEKRTLKTVNTVSIFLCSQLSSIIAIYYLIIITMFLVHQSTFFGKIAFYGLFGVAFGLAMIDFWVNFIRLKFVIDSLPQLNPLCRLVVFLLILGIGEVGYPFLLAFINKSFWFFIYCCGGLVIQLGYSLSRKVTPHHKFMALHSITLLQIVLLSTYYPVLNFHESSMFEFMFIFVLIVVLILGGYLIINKYIATQKTSIDKMGDKDNNTEISIQQPTVLATLSETYTFPSHGSGLTD